MTDAYALAQLSELNDAWKRWVPPNGSEAHQNIIALDMAISALQEREERSKGCEYCKESKDIYQVKSELHDSMNEDVYVVVTRL